MKDLKCLKKVRTSKKKCRLPDERLKMKDERFNSS
jgi:hypothetical protein